MMLKKIDLLFVLLIFISSLLFVADIFINKGQPATFDGTIHITTIAQVYRGLKEGEHRVTWADGFANYGMPIPLIAQQTTLYLGSLLNFWFKDVLFSYNLVFLIGAFASAVFYYFFLRIYFKSTIAFAGTFLFNFAPYRIINLYIRGDQPEFFASVFIPLVLIGIYLVTKKKNLYGTLFLSISTALLILTHPFMLVVGGILFIPYIIFCIYDQKQKKELLFLIFLSIGLGVGIAAFYIIPLVIESKYFYLSLEKNRFVANQFLSFANYFDPKWYYYYKNDTFIRGNFIKVDLLETLITIIGFCLLIFSYKKIRREGLLIFAVGTSLMLIFLTISPSNFLYQKIGMINSLQFPWRMLSSYIFVTPIILCIILQKIKYQNLAIAIIIVLISILRFPQIYGKNYTIFPQSKYFFTTENLHSASLNTIWTGKTSEYPVEKKKIAVINGKANITNEVIKNSSRSYTINALTDIRMVDYTFYFPGWRAYVDGAKIPIQYQDPSYRGVITYNVPKGKHAVMLKFENTIDRIVGYLVSVFSILVMLGLFYFTKRKIRIYHSGAPKALHK